MDDNKILCIFMIIQLIVKGLTAETEAFRGGQAQDSCSTDELSHSILIECNDLICSSETPEQELWPLHDKDVIHMYSTRDGERFVVNKLSNLDYQEPEQVRMLDINNTLYADSAQIQPDGDKTHFNGFGTTITQTHIAYVKEGSFGKNFEPIFRDLFSLPPRGIGFDTLRLQLTREILLQDLQHTIDLISQIDDAAFDMVTDVGQKRIKVIVSLEGIDDGSGLYESLFRLAKSLKDSRRLKCQAVVLNKKLELRNDKLEQIDLGDLFDANNLLDMIDVVALKQNLRVLDDLSSDGSRGILIKTEFSYPYNVLKRLREMYYRNDVVTLGGFRRKAGPYGNWKNALDYAVSIMNNLKFGSNSFIEEVSANDILADPNGLDSSIYSLRKDHNTHFRGPMYYAIGHFSRHIIQGSSILKINVTTAPNVFAAQYMAVSVPSKDCVVAIVLNDNEHLLPFRFAVDGRLKLYADIKPKSFNTFVVRK